MEPLDGLARPCFNGGMTSAPDPARPVGRVPRPTRIVDEITAALAAYDQYRKDSAS